jgi:hypothetical protein
LGGDQRRIQAQFGNVVDLRERLPGIVERQHPDPFQPPIGGAEFGHGEVVGVRGAVTPAHRPIGIEDHLKAEGREHQLSGKAENVQCLAAFARVEGAERSETFRTIDQPVPEGDQFVVVVSTWRPRRATSSRSASFAHSPRHTGVRSAMSRRSSASAYRFRKSGNSIMWLSAS